MLWLFLVAAVLLAIALALLRAVGASRFGAWRGGSPPHASVPNAPAPGGGVVGAGAGAADADAADASAADADTANVKAADMKVADVAGGAPRGPLLPPGISPHLSHAEAAAARRRFTAGAAAWPPAPAGPDRGAALVFWNVHQHTDPFGADRRAAVAARVAEFAADPDVECVALAEAAPSEAARAALAGFSHVIETPNGGTLLAVGWRGGGGAAAAAVPTTGSRNCILYTTRGGLRVAVVHLEIGARPAADAGASAAVAARNRDIRRANAAVRVRQLAALLAHAPDLLVGDFNFELGGAEAAWLAARGYRAANAAAPWSTPFNRVDHCFVRADRKTADLRNRLLPIALTDHLPLRQQLG